MSVFHLFWDDSREWLREQRCRPSTAAGQRFTLRVWEDENVDFDAIEDVQVIFNYRYWTRQD